MVKRFIDNKKLHESARDKSGKVFDGIKKAKLGTQQNPAAVTVKTKKRRKEVDALFAKNGWECTIELDPDKPEDTADLERLLNPLKPKTVEKTPGRNDPCPCGSGKKYKKCCGK